MRLKVSILLSVILFASCVEIEEVSPVPEITYKSFAYDYIYNLELDESLFTRVLEFDFIDGDADLGVYDEMNELTYLPDSFRHGIFISFFEKLDGVYFERFFTEESTMTLARIDSVLMDTVWVYDTIKYDTLLIDTISLNQLLPYDEKLDRVGQNKTVKGTIRIGMFFPAELPYDTMRLEFYIRDRALNKSNIEVTEDFINADLESPLSGGIPGE
ncbi:MAG: hypothetical protein JXA77_13930 [Bacteroidales bacterium]|nr:hypothetical protein [Bacteroidales bacterium]MBN2819202.1 hypothetical protein [Bacteroidales bacterium]